ncbi:MAG: DUF1273 domain-containing protein [Prevotellaceae bacterium]|nr:MAG: DUF1273 domain-containing protein [Prevotellaceae bacterium]
MTEAEMRGHRCCFTGHRPEKLLCSKEQITTDLTTAIDNAISDGYRTFISGIAMGVDIWAAQIILEKKTVLSGLHLICALPFPGFGDRWPSQWSDAYREIIAQADLVKSISPAFSYASFQRRNKWMVDHSGRVIAVYNGCSGGTRNTMIYAQQNNVPCILISG